MATPISLGAPQFIVNRGIVQRLFPSVVHRVDMYTNAAYILWSLNRPKQTGKLWRS